jgi:PAT family beta-lactamase induction signal transducer AmpG
MNRYLSVFASFRMLVVLLLGFSSGIPLALTTGTLQAWMTDVKVDLTVIGIFALVGLPYQFKFVWSPLLDRYVPPFLGRRRGWMLIAQAALAAAIAVMAFSEPATHPGFLALMALLVAFFSASQDIVIDAYRIEVLKPDELGAGSSIYVLGYRVAMLVSGALALFLADHLAWKQVYLIMAATMAVGVVTTLLSPEPTMTEKPVQSLREAVVLPLLDYFKRKGAWEIVGFILLFKLGWMMASMMTTPFLMQTGFTKTEIAAVNKGFGMVATILGSLFGGALMVRMSMKQALWVFGIFQGVSNLAFLHVAQTGVQYVSLVSAIAAENFAGGMGTAAYSAFLMSLCNKRFSATQYALLTSLMAGTRNFAGAASGYLAKSLGWEMYFVACTVLAVPGLLMLLRYRHWTRE